MTPTIGPTPALRRELERLMAKGADLPDVDWETMPAVEIARTLMKVKGRYVRERERKRETLRRNLWAVGDLPPAPRRRTGFGGQ